MIKVQVMNVRSHTYKCQDCEQTFCGKFEYAEHKNVHSGDCPFMCPDCHRLFPTVSDYVTHLDHCNSKVKNGGSSSPKNERDEMGTCKSSNEEIIQDKVSHEPLDLQMADETESMNSDRRVPQIDFEESGKIVNLSKRNNDNCDECYNTDEPNEIQTGKNYYCSQCPLKFSSRKKYCEHKKESHTFLCENCNSRYSSSEKLDRHVCFVSSDGEPFKCSCSLTFTKASQFKVHIGSKPYSCCKCYMQFNRVTNLIRHVRTHTKQKPYICKHCGRGFSQSTNLRNHMSVHLGVKAVKCDECNFSCKTLSGLVKHKKKHREGYVRDSNYIDKRKTSTEPISCPICKKEFPFKRNVGMHMKIHKRIESLCQECGKVFDSKSKLTTHYKACHGVPSVCQTCGKTFASSVLLAAHEKIHVTGKNFSCSKCCKVFSIKNYLVQHMKTHLEGKQYSCSKCGKLFKVAVSLKYHSKICMNFSS